MRRIILVAFLISLLGVSAFLTPALRKSVAQPSDGNNAVLNLAHEYHAVSANADHVPVSVQEAPPPKPAFGQPSKSIWEYRHLVLSGLQDAMLNSLGSEGWELVSASTVKPGTYDMFFKRARVVASPYTSPSEGGGTPYPATAPANRRSGDGG